MATRRTRPNPGPGTETAKAAGPAPRKASTPVAGKKVPRKRTARPASAAPAPDAAGNDAPASAGLWRAGLKALDTVRQDVTRRHTNVIETLLGIAPARPETEGKPAPRSFPGLEALGLRKFEDVFDQRVAAALERLGVPSRDEVETLRARLDEALAQLERLQGSTPAPRQSASGKKR